MATPRRGLARLFATDGHSHWAEPVLRGLPNGLAYTLSADCAFGGVAVYLCDCWSGREPESGDGEVPRHRHEWSLLTSSDGARQCLGRDCFALRMPDGEILEEA